MSERLQQIPRKSRPVDLGTIDKDYAGTVIHVRSNLSTGALERLDELQSAKDFGPIRAALLDLIDDWNIADPRPTAEGRKRKALAKLPLTEAGMAELPLPMIVAVVGAIADAQRLPKAAARPSARTTRRR